MSKKNPDGQDDVDAMFGEIVADLRAEGIGARSDLSERGETQATPEEDSTRGEQKPTPGANWRSSEADWDETMLSDAVDEDDDEHFVPPEPPPLHKPTGSMLVVGLFFVIGLLLLIAPAVVGIGAGVATPLGILSLAAGLGFLLLHAKDDPRPPGSDPGNGAQV